MLPARLLMLLLLMISLPAAAAPGVLTSIRPLQLIANDILRGVGTAEVLLDSRQSPHHFQLKPSQLRKLQQTDLLIWISDDFETGLARLKKTLPDGARQLQLMPLLDRQPDMEVETHQQASHDDEHKHEHHHDGNAHIWLSPRDDLRIAALIADTLARMDPPNADRYRANLEKLDSRLRAEWRKAQAQLQAAKPRFLLDHPFLEPYEQDLGVHSLGALAGVNARGGSARHLHELEQKLQETPARCLFSAEWPADRRSRQFARQFNIELQWLPILDPEQRARSIVDMLDDITQRLAACGETDPPAK